MTNIAKRVEELQNVTVDKKLTENIKLLSLKQKEKVIKITENIINWTDLKWDNSDNINWIEKVLKENKFFLDDLFPEEIDID